MSIYILNEVCKKRVLVRCSRLTSKRSTVDFRTTKKRSTTNISGHPKRGMLTFSPRVACPSSSFFSARCRKGRLAAGNLPAWEDRRAEWVAGDLLCEYCLGARGA
ncbi:hypothetical protein Bxe_B2362 [Paraburkholderia xenovorans LB400]|uniref:Uncharacterized protein n=1 Tax=Paraburkholderia xenovorans (strain LB400) TaxID=266265 RepID=Q13QL2_PARXL|nr:hypothetical protein Bxe_B2362 [Paraburkholderia xenovorans LB400]